MIFSSVMVTTTLSEAQRFSEIDFVKNNTILTEKYYDLLISLLC